MDPPLNNNPPAHPRPAPTAPGPLIPHDPGSGPYYYNTDWEASNNLSINGTFADPDVSPGNGSTPPTQEPDWEVVVTTARIAVVVIGFVLIGLNTLFVFAFKCKKQNKGGLDAQPYHGKKSSKFSKPRKDNREFKTPSGEIARFPVAQQTTSLEEEDRFYIVCFQAKVFNGKHKEFRV